MTYVGSRALFPVYVFFPLLDRPRQLASHGPGVTLNITDSSTEWQEYHKFHPTSSTTRLSSTSLRDVIISIVRRASVQGEVAAGPPLVWPCTTSVRRAVQLGLAVLGRERHLLPMNRGYRSVSSILSSTTTDAFRRLRCLATPRQRGGSGVGRRARQMWGRAKRRPVGACEKRQHTDSCKAELARIAILSLLMPLRRAAFDYEPSESL